MSFFPNTFLNIEKSQIFSKRFSIFHLFKKIRIKDWLILAIFGFNKIGILNHDHWEMEVGDEFRVITRIFNPTFTHPIYRIWTLPLKATSLAITTRLSYLSCNKKYLWNFIFVTSEIHYWANIRPKILQLKIKNFRFILKT